MSLFNKARPINGVKDYNLPLFVLRLIENGPADRSNLMMIGDVIEAINGVSIGTQFEVSNQK